jgi:agmatine deiminase
MKKIISILLSVLIASISFSQSKTEHFTYPGEFEKIDAIWMDWNTWDHSDSSKESASYILRMTKEITPYAMMNMIVLNDSDKNDAILSMLNFGIDTSRVSFYYITFRRMFIRDFGPIFLKGDQGHLKGVDFNYNCYGMCKPYSEGTERGTMDSVIEKQMGLEIIKTKVCSEGGDREFNGKGTMLTVEAVELQRNPSMTKQQLEAEYKRIFGVKKVIWLKRGTIDDDKSQFGILPCGIYPFGTGGHIDEFCRFVDAHTILLAEESNKGTICDSLALINNRRLEENYNILKSSTDQNGKPFRIIRIPVPDYEYNTGTIEAKDTSQFAGSHIGQIIKVMNASSYLNFIIANQVVLIPKYYKEGALVSTKEKDEEALKTFQQVFPERKIVQLDVLFLNLQGGGMHCATQQQTSIKNK